MKRLLKFLNEKKPCVTLCTVQKYNLPQCYVLCPKEILAGYDAIMEYIEGYIHEKDKELFYVFWTFFRRGYVILCKQIDKETLQLVDILQIFLQSSHVLFAIPCVHCTTIYSLHIKKFLVNIVSPGFVAFSL